LLYRKKSSIFVLNIKNMKNTIYIDVDTNNEKPITFSKPSGFDQPSDFDGAKSFILNDITCLCEGICTLITLADQNKYGKKEDLIKAITGRLNDML
jgi:hypothetical protein